MAMISFDHCNTPDRGHAFLRELGRRGFAVSTQIVDHPNGHSCRFVFLSTTGDTDGWQALEFVSAPRSEALRVGLSFAVAGKLADHFESVKNDRYMRPRLTHRNYDWKTRGHRIRLPGWNYLNFGRRSPFGEVWFTEYEPRGPGSGPRRMQPQPNGCAGVWAFRLEVNRIGRRFLGGVLGRSVTGDTLVLGGGVELHLEPSRRNRIAAVVLSAPRFAHFLRVSRLKRSTVYRGRPATEIANPNGHWNVLVTGPALRQLSGAPRRR